MNLLDLLHKSNDVPGITVECVKMLDKGVQTYKHARARAHTYMLYIQKNSLYLKLHTYSAIVLYTTSHYNLHSIYNVFFYLIFLITT